MANRVIAANSVPFSGADKFGSGTPQYFTSGNPVSAVPATVLPGAWTNMVQDELTNMALAAGLAPDGNNWQQCLESLFLATTLFDTSVTANTLTFNPPIALPTSVVHAGFSFLGRVANMNTSQVVNATVSGGPSTAVTDVSGQPIQVGDLRANRFYRFVHDGSGYRIISGMQRLELPIAGLVVFVRTDGNDLNNGLTNSPSGAFLTIQGALDGVSNQYALAPDKTVSVVMGIPGTYTGNFNVPSGSSFFVQGLTNAPSSYVISGGTVPNVDVVSAAKGSALTVLQCTVQNVSNTRNWSNAENGAVVTFDNVNFSQIGSTATTVMAALAGGSIICLNATFTSITCGAFFSATGAGANILISSDGISSAQWIGSNTASTATAVANENGTIQVGAWTTSGSVTGTRYVSQYNGIIDSGGQGVNKFPGTVAGTPGSGVSNLGGWYIA